MEIIKMEIGRLANDPNNARRHPEKNLKAIKGSLAKFGQQKPIVIDSKNVVIAGNGTLEAAKELGWTHIDVVVTELDELGKMAFALADNKTSELAEWDDDTLRYQLDWLDKQDFNSSDIGFDDFSLDDDKTKDYEDAYTKKIKSPIYEPKGKKPELEELLDYLKTKKLIEEIEQSNIDDDIKDFMIKSAYRHTVFRYDKIAEYYAHAPKDVQGLMEKSALIIIDFNQAIENGFVKLTENLVESYLEDQSDE
jgi:ParB-like chromosome segregation protein Spo0J